MYKQQWKVWQHVQLLFIAKLKVFTSEWKRVVRYLGSSILDTDDSITLVD